MPDPVSATIAASTGLNMISGQEAAKAQSKAAKNAAKLEAQTAREQLALQQRMYEEGVARAEPFRQSGLTANNRLMTLLGLEAPRTLNTPSLSGVNLLRPSAGEGGARSFDELANPSGWIDGRGLGRLVGGLSGTVSGAMTPPERDPDFGKYAGSFSDLGDNWTRDPGYQFRLNEGLKALDRNAAARGGLISGNALKAAQRYGQGMASQEYQNAFNRYYAEREAALNPLQSLAGVGQTTAQGMNAAGQNYAGTAANTAMAGANAVGNYWTQGADARASGYMGQTNALNSALGSYMGYQQNQANNALGQRYMNLLEGQNNGYAMPDPYTYQYGG